MSKSSKLHISHFSGGAALSGEVFSRRTFCTRAAAAILLAVTPRSARALTIYQQLHELERATGGTLGIAVRSSTRGDLLDYKSSVRFPLCSTHKVLAVAAILEKADQGDLTLEKRIFFNQGDLVAHSPKTLPFAQAAGLTVAQLCEAAMCYSDNTASNLLVKLAGGTSRITSRVRSWGDAITRLDRMEPELNKVSASEQRDTTTPRSMSMLLQHLLCSKRLSQQSRSLLADWMVANTTGSRRLRAGFPSHWRVGDKTGSGSRNATNDVAALWLPQGERVFVAAYSVDSVRPLATREACLAAVGRLVTSIVRP